MSPPAAPPGEPRRPVEPAGSESTAVADGTGAAASGGTSSGMPGGRPGRRTRLLAVLVAVLTVAAMALALSHPVPTGPPELPSGEVPQFALEEPAQESPACDSAIVAAYKSPYRGVRSMSGQNVARYDLSWKECQVKARPRVRLAAALGLLALALVAVGTRRAAAPARLATRSLLVTALVVPAAVTALVAGLLNR